MELLVREVDSKLFFDDDCGDRSNNVYLINFNCCAATTVY